MKLKLRHCVINLLYKTFTRQGNKLPLNDMRSTSHRGAAFPFSPLFCVRYLIVTLFCPILVFRLVKCLNLNDSSYFALIFFFFHSSSLLSSFFLIAALRSSVPSLLAFSIFSSWLPSPGCVWRVCNCISCSWRSLRASTHAKSTTICAATASPRWWWASRQP